ncbi:hypothetical protein ACLI4Z_02175 [Natrialbaceae archaeon A-arb3/5]
MNRRQYLCAAGAATAGSLAGCTSDTPDTTTDAESDTSDETNADDSDDEQPPAELDQEALRMGESVLFYTEDGSKELTFRPSDPLFRDVLITDRPDQGLVASDLPADDSLYLTVQIGMENVGERSVDVPTTIELHVDGTTYSHKRTALNDEYSITQALDADESTTRYAVFEVPQDRSDAAGRLTAEWGGVESATAEWDVDLGEAPRERASFEGKSVGETVMIGTDDVRFSVAFQSVTTEDDGDETSVFATLSAENTGERTIQDPTIRGVSLLADGQEFDPEPYDGDDEYESGELDPGADRSGVFHFRIPQSIEPDELRVALTSDLEATWNVE